ncbi:SIMPL domain-containing protein [Variovorax paradoxus]|uniref:SIMPL domain-containing protein n=1 Tax=Variovorax paradoxus TaxID=34073 RepID=UPI003D64DBE6
MKTARPISGCRAATRSPAMHRACGFTGATAKAIQLTRCGCARPSATVRVAPDEVFLTIGVQSRNKSLRTATLDNRERVSKALGVLKQHGVPDTV